MQENLTGTWSVIHIQSAIEVTTKAMVDGSLEYNKTIAVAEQNKSWLWHD